MLIRVMFVDFTWVDFFKSIVVPAISAGVTLITLYIKNHWDKRSLKLSFEAKYKEIIFKQQIEYYEKFSEASWKLNDEIAKFLLDNNKKNEELMKVQNTLASSIAICQFAFSKNIIEKMHDFRCGAQEIIGNIKQIKRPVDIEKYADKIILLEKLRLDAIEMIRNSLYIE